VNGMVIPSAVVQFSCHISIFHRQLKDLGGLIYAFFFSNFNLAGSTYCLVVFSYSLDPLLTSTSFRGCLLRIL